jgi:hypothetical protein
VVPEGIEQEPLSGNHILAAIQLHAHYNARYHWSHQRKETDKKATCLFYKIEATVPDLDFCVSFERDLYRAVLPEKRIEFKDEPRQIFSGIANKIWHKILCLASQAQGKVQGIIWL